MEQHSIPPPPSSFQYGWMYPFPPPPLPPQSSSDQTATSHNNNNNVNIHPYFHQQMALYYQHQLRLYQDMYGGAGSTTMYPHVLPEHFPYPLLPPPPPLPLQPLSNNDIPQEGKGPTAKPSQAIPIIAPEN